jgi:large subunit ribosomal protein L17
MRHRKRGRVLGRSPAHRKALFQNLAKALFLTEDPSEPTEGSPKVKGRIVTTIQKAKEVRSFVEKCVTIAKKANIAEEKAKEHATSATRGTAEWKTWREGAGWKKWAQAMAPVVNARRRMVAMLNERGDENSKGDKRAVRILFEVIAPRFADRKGGYTRILRLAKPRLGDAGTRAILEFVGVNDRKVQKAAAPSFEKSAEPAGAK